MARYFVGQRVRLICVEDPHDPLADDWGTVGDEGRVVGGGRYFAHCPEGGYDCICHFPSYGEYCAWNWQLEPILPEGAQPSEFTTLRDLMDSLEGVRA